MKKRLLASVLCVAMAGTLLAGCGSKDTAGSTSQASAAGTEAKTEAAKKRSRKDGGSCRNRSFHRDRADGTDFHLRRWR